MFVSATGVGRSRNQCAVECEGFGYFAVQFGNECFCDEDYGTPPANYYRVDDSECDENADVNGNPGKGHGAARRNAVYRYTSTPTTSPTLSPTASPSAAPSAGPTGDPSVTPTKSPTISPTLAPTAWPSMAPSFGYETCRKNENELRVDDFISGGKTVY